MGPEREIACELCLVGAGVAGLNALSSAKPYLDRGDVVVVDRRAAPGGMWNDTYDYVRLHQPHPMFTVGAVPWSTGQSRAHLATKPEIQRHLERCTAEVFAGLSVTELYESEYLSHEEVEGDGRRVVVRIRDADGNLFRVVARTLIKAYGFNVWPKEPLRLSSEAVRSVTPHDASLFEDDSPVWVVGSGKTAMDTVAKLVERHPGRRIHMIAGSGTVFLNRAIGFPEGLRAFFGGTTGFRIALDVSTRFDGTNGPAVADHFRDRYGLSLHPASRHHAFGIISPQEMAAVRDGVTEVKLGHLRDVRDGVGGPELVLDDGSTREIPEGSFVVSCTGYLDADLEYEPFRSPGGAVLSVSARSALHLLTTHTGFALPHLHFRGHLDRLPFYELDAVLLRRKDKVSWASVMYVHSLYNMLLIIDALPPDVLETMGVNLDNWYPLPRRLWDLVEIKRRGSEHVDRSRRILDRVRGRYEGVACGPLASG